jgi:hypothetical protein
MGGLPALSERAQPQAASGDQQDTASQAIRTLEFGSAIEREIAGGEAHSYQFTLAAGEYARIAIERRGIGLFTSLFAGGEQLSEVDNWYVRAVSVLAKQESSYRIEVRAPRARLRGIIYIIKIEEKHAAMPEDEQRMTAEKIRRNCNCSPCLLFSSSLCPLVSPSPCLLVPLSPRPLVPLSPTP